jgi:hypothetical protein
LGREENVRLLPESLGEEAGDRDPDDETRIERMKTDFRTLTLSDWGRAVVKRRSAVLRAELHRLVRKPDEEAIHDVRVATRRLRAALRHLDVCFPRAAVKEADRAVRSLASILGEARDMDIVLQNLRPAAGGAAFGRWRSGLRRQRAGRLRSAVPAARRLARRLPSLERSLLS